MKKLNLLIGVFALTASAQVYAGATPIVGTGSIAENGCVAFVELFTGGQSCLYNESRWAAPIAAPRWIGPFYTASYYPQGDGPGLSNPGGANPGGSKQGPAIGGKISITGSGEAAVIGGTIDVGPATVAFLYQAPAAAEVTWKRLRYTIAAKVADSATPNGFGGYTYVIGTQGVPAPLVSLSGLYTFPSEVTGGFFFPPFWQAPGVPGVNDTAGISTMGGEIASSLPNIGTTATASFQQASCTDIVDEGSCDSPLSPLLDGDIDNLLMVIDTNECGRVLTGRAIATREADLVGFGPQAVDAYNATTWTFQTGPDDDSLNNECND
jgi:hypothetical protein